MNLGDDQAGGGAHAFALLGRFALQRDLALRLARGQDLAAIFAQGFNLSQQRDDRIKACALHQLPERCRAQKGLDRKTDPRVTATHAK